MLCLVIQFGMRVTPLWICLRVILNELTPKSWKYDIKCSICIVIDLWYKQQKSPYKMRKFCWFKKLHFEWCTLKGSLILSHPQCKDGNVRFTTVPLKSLSDQLYERYCRFSRIKSFNSKIIYVSAVEMRNSQFSKEKTNFLND